MAFGDERGVSAIIGGVLLLLILVLLFSTLQTTAVPNWNDEVEFEHNGRVQDDMQALRNTALAVAADGNRRSAIIELGTAYPSRVVLRNPTAPQGTLRTDDPGTLTIDNATVADRQTDYWDGSPNTFTTRPFVYSPDYNYYSNAPDTVAEVGIVYNRFSEVNLTVTDQTLIDGNRITLVMVNGSFRAQGSDDRTVDLVPVSAPMRSRTIRNETGPVTIKLPTMLSNESWADSLRSEYVSNGGHITDQSYVPGSPYNTLVLTLEEDVNYVLKLAQVGVGTDVNDPGPHYIVNTSGSGEEILVDDEQELRVQVRDRFNNPVSNVVVDASVIDGAGTVTPAEVRTDEDGRATFTYSSPDETTATIQASFGTNPPDRQKTNFTVTVTEPGGNPVTLAGIRFDDSNRNGNIIELTFTNTIEDDRNITAFRLVFYQGGDPDTGTISSPSNPVSSESFEVTGPSINLDPQFTIEAGQTKTYTIDFDSYNPSSGDWFVFTFAYDTGQTAQYFTAV